MGRTVQSDAIQEGFLDALRAEGAVVENMSELAGHTSHGELRFFLQSLGRNGRNVFFLEGVGMVQIHVRSEPPGWWNVLKSVKEHLDQLHKHYFVFLIGRKDQYVANGYIASDFNRPPFIRHPSVEATKFTINEKQDLDPNARLLSVSKIAKVLLGLRKVPEAT